MSIVITGSYTIGLTLSTSPTTITGSIDTSLDAIDGAANRQWHLVNSGLVESTGDLGIRLLGAGDVANTGTILGKYEGVFIGTHGVVTNSGTIAAASLGSAVFLDGGGTVNNEAGGQISGVYGVEIAGKGNVLNQGTIIGSGSFGAAINIASGTVQNAANGVICGLAGVDLFTTGTIINAGTIAANAPGGTAINLGSGTRNMLVIDPGSTIIGAIADFAAQDVIDFANTTLTTEIFANSSLTLSNSGGVVAVLNLAGDFDDSEFTLSSDGAGGSRITLGLDVITARTVNGETLNAPRTSIAAGVTVSGTADGVTGGDFDWSLTNSGIILGGNFGYDSGIDLINAGVITNNAGGLVEGGIGVRIGSGRLIDAGTIASTLVQGIAIELLATTSDVGIVLDPGAVLIGAIGGFVTGDTIDLANTRINSEVFANGVLTLSNNGSEVEALTLTGGFNTAEFALASDGKSGTELTLQATEIISGIYTTGIALSARTTTITAAAQINTFGTAVSGAAGRDWTLVNSGEVNAEGIQSFNDFGVSLSSGQITNTSLGLIRGATGVVMSDGRFINDGNVQGLNRYSYGFIDLDSAYFSNDRSGVITGGLGVHLQNATAQNAGQITATNPNAAGVNIIGVTTFNNTGTITAATGIRLNAGAEASNSGTIIGTGGNYYGAQSFGHAGLRMSGGQFTNGANGVIEGPTGVTLTGGALLNAGTIMGVSGGYYQNNASFASVGALIGGGSVSNAASGLISGATGVVLNGGVLEDAGTIATTATLRTAIAVDFGTHAATLVLDPSAIIDGFVEHFGTGDVIVLAGIGSGATLTVSPNMYEDPVATIAGGSTESQSRSLTFGGTDFFALLPIAGGAELLGNTQIIYGGETAAGGTVGPPFQLLVLSGGVDTGSTILAGGSETIYAGGAVYIDAATTTGLTLSTGSTEIIGAGATVSAVTVAAGITLAVDGTANGAVVNSGGTMVVAAGGTASGTVIVKGGTETVLAGGSTDITSASTPGLTLNSGSTEIIADGVTVNGAKIAAGIRLDVSGTASTSRVASGGMEFIYADGSVVNGSVLSGGMLTVYSGAVVAGGLSIFGGTALIYGSVTSGEDLSFAGPGGSLELDNAGFAGMIKGFGLGDTIDLINVPFGAAATFSFAKAKNGASGVLTVADGDQQINLALKGSYSNTNFTLSSGALGGTQVLFTSGGTV